MTKWTIDPSHSEVQFKVKYLMITTISGQLKNYDLEVFTTDEDFTSASKIEFTAAVDSIDTDNEQRDAHLKSADFFNVAQYPELRFSGKKFERRDDDYLLHGELTIKGITQPISLEVDFGGIILDPYNRTKAGFTITGKLSRKSFGLIWDNITESGLIVVGDEIRINCNIQLIKS